MYVDALAELLVAGRAVHPRTRRQVVPQAVPGDALRFPAAVDFGLRLEARLLAIPAEQAIGLQAEQELGVELRRVPVGPGEQLARRPVRTARPRARRTRRAAVRRRCARCMTNDSDRSDQRRTEQSDVMTSSSRGQRRRPRWRSEACHCERSGPVYTRARARGDGRRCVRNRAKSV